MTNLNMGISLVALIAIVLVLAVLVIYYFSVNNREVALRKEADAQRGKIETVHDTMWKTLKQEAGVTEQYRDAFEKIYPDLIRGRYANDQGGMMKWIQEQNPNFDTSLYRDLSQAIEVQRTIFSNAQQRMLDILRERETLIESMPAKFFISNKTRIDYEVISSTNTKSVLETRIDDDITL